MSNDAIRDMRAGADVDTLEGKVKLAIAIELDEMFITSGNGLYSLHPMFAKNFGEVRDRLYNAVMRKQFEVLPDYRQVDPMDPGESDEHYAKHEGFVAGWNECLDAVKAAKN